MKQRLLRFAAVCAALFLLTWIYFTNPMEQDKTNFLKFQQDSNALVYSNVVAQQEGLPNSPYGLGFYCNVLGELYPSYSDFQAAQPIHQPENGIDRGFLTDQAGIAVPFVPYTQIYLQPGNVVQFPNGQRFTVTNTTQTDTLWVVGLDSDSPLQPEIYGDLSDILLFSPDGTQLPTGFFGEYASQYGLQGKLLRSLSSVLPGAVDTALPLVCAFAFALAVTATAWLLWKRYNLLAAACFFVIFALSSWTIAFARSVYWVECTWLLPAIAGLLLSLHRDDRRWRMAMYVGMLLATMVKSLCGYEYLTFVMLCGVLPLMWDVLEALVQKNYGKAKTYFCTLVIAGIFSLLGFVLALLLHANIRGGGDLLGGLQQIYEKDVLRRAIGGNAADFTGSVKDSIEASVGEVVLMYFRYAKRTILGITVYLFPLLLAAPVCVTLLRSVLRRKPDIPALAAYAMAMITSLSWIVLGKQHSFVHTHLNYVAWFYPMVPLCIYQLVMQSWLLLWDIIERIENKYGRIGWLHRICRQ